MQKSIYEAADFFLVRTALLPYKQVELSPEALFEFYRNTPLFQEAIAIASCSLYDSLSKSLDNIGERNKLFPSLLKYFLRMSSRATPFGLFSAIGWGEFADRADLSFSYSSLDKKVHPDAEWSKALLEELHQEITAVRNLNVMTNPNLVKRGGRVFLRAENENATALDSISIKSTMVSDFVFYCAKTPILYVELENKLIEKFDEHPRETVAEYLWQVFQKGYLLSECSFSLEHPFSLKTFYEKSLVKDKSEDLIAKFESYENTSFGKGCSQLNEAIQLANQKKVVKHPIQVNAHRKTGVFHLPGTIKERIEETVSLLWTLSNDDSSPLKSYHSQFQEKYGFQRLVPLLELIDPQHGLGMPSTPTLNQQAQDSPSWKNAVFSSLKNKTLNLEDFPAQTPSREKIQKAPLSFELYCEVLAHSEKELDAGNYTLLVSPVGSSMQAGSTFGRFLYLCTPDQQQQLRSFLQKEEALLPHTICVEASFLPDNARLVNVAFHEKIRSYQLEMHFHNATGQTIELDDIYVGATENHIYLFSKKWKKELYITLSSVVNVNLAPPVLQFLLQVSKGRFSSFSPFIWHGAEQEVFLPRFCYKNVILSPARWFIRLSALGLSEKPSSTDMEKALEGYLISLEVPDRIHLAEMDNKLALNWKNKDHFRLILQHLTSKKLLFIYEAINSEQNLPVHSELGRHVTEFVVPCVKKSDYKNNSPVIHYPPCTQIRHLDRRQVAGSDWLYIKFFLSHENETAFLKTQLSSLVHSCLENCFVDKWFYVRYMEEKAHIRLRLHGQQQHLFQSVLPMLYKHASKWISDGILGDFSIHTYEKEVERYGGPECIELAETLFFADSESCIQILQGMGSYNLPLYVMGALAIINLVQGFYPSADEQIAFFSPYLHKGSLLTGVREHTSKAVQTALALFYETDQLNPHLHALKEAFFHTRQAAQCLEESRINLGDIQWNTKQHIVQSLLHMHCNRLFGIDKEAECKAHVTAHHFLQKIQYKLKQEEALCNSR